MKKLLSLALGLCLALTLCISPTLAAGVTATKTASKVTVDGTAKSFDAYTIAENNYFKLRDIASVLSGTGKQFEVTWDGAKNAINLVSGKPYTAVGGEMTPAAGTTNKTATLSTSKIYVDGKEVTLTAYAIDGNNYFKLRDLGATFNFGVEWDGAANSIAIKSTVGYTPETPAMKPAEKPTDASNFKYEKTADGKGICITGYNGTPAKISIPGTINGLPVIVIGQSAFNGCDKLATVSIPNSVTTIENYAFTACTALTAVVIPDSVTSMGNGVFGDCTALSSVTISNGLQKIGSTMFANCTSLTAVTIPSSVTEIDYNAFAGSGLTSFTMPNTVTKIGDNLFSKCEKLTSVTLSESLDRIPMRAFNGCSSLTTITIPENVKSLAGDVFDYCTSLTTVILKGNLTYPPSGGFGLKTTAGTYTRTPEQAATHQEFTLAP